VADPDPEARAARHAWRPHLREAAVLAQWGGVTAALDVSDGLLLDASRLPVAVHIDSASVPTGPLYQRRHPDPRLAMVGGEDYVLLFTTGRRPPIGIRIGSCVPGRGVCVDGEPVRPEGWDHF
jgi:thiamine monophosphate kinase